MNIDELLSSGPHEQGTITAYDGGIVRYELRLLPPGRLNEIKIERQAYLRDQGIEDLTPATAEIFDQELRIRICADSVLNPDTSAPLASLDVWRRSTGSAVETCIRHYTQLEAREAPTDMELSQALPLLAEHIKKNDGPGSAAFWKTIDYETLLACFTTLVLQQANSVSGT